MTRDEYIKAIRLCAYGHHKVRQNKYGVCWCVRCGLLINSSITFEQLRETDKIIVNGRTTSISWSSKAAKGERIL